MCTCASGVVLVLVRMHGCVLVVVGLIVVRIGVCLCITIEHAVRQHMSPMRFFYVKASAVSESAHLLESQWVGEFAWTSGVGQCYSARQFCRTLHDIEC